MEPLSILGNIGLGVAGNAVYEFLKARLNGPNPPTKEQLQTELQNVINMNGVQVSAATVIDSLASNGIITIRQSKLHGPDGVTIGAVNGYTFFGDNGVTSTDKTAIRSQGIGTGIGIQGTGAVKQNPNGSISFHTGPGGGISFFVGGN